MLCRKKGKAEPGRQSRDCLRGGGGAASFEGDDALEVLGLREEVERLDASQPVLVVGEELYQIAHLGGGIARNVDDPGGLEVEELADELFVTAFARRVDDDGGLRGVEGDFVEDCFGFSLEEIDVGEGIFAGVVPGPVDGLFADLDADDAFETRSSSEGEEPATTVGIDEETETVRCRLFGDVLGEAREDGRVVLGKNSPAMNSKVTSSTRSCAIVLGSVMTLSSDVRRRRVAPFLYRVALSRTSFRSGPRASLIAGAAMGQ